jgi:hypothetical protein
VLFFVWIALGIGAAATLGGVAFAASRALAAWRTFRAFRRHVFDALDDLSRRADAIGRGAAHAADSTVRLQRAQAGLQESLAAARVLSAAFAEVRAVVGQVTGLVPSK